MNNDTIKMIRTENMFNGDATKTFKSFLRIPNQSLYALLLCMLAACGGSKNSTPVSIPTYTQNLSFAQSSINLAVDGSTTNVATGKGSGTLSYTSSDTSIVTVDNNGTVKALALGTATINATITADTTYPSGTASYILHVVPAAPTTLTDKRLTLHLAKTGVVISNQFPNIGEITSYFHDTHFIEEGGETGIGNPAGTYTMTIQNINNILLDEKNDFDMVHTKLVFVDKNSGTFSRNYYSPDGTQVALTHEGTFNIDDMPFQIIPDDFTNRTLELDFTKVQSTLPADESPVVNQSFNALFLNGTQINFSPSTNITWPANYSVHVDDLYNVTISGKFDSNGKFGNSGRSYELHLNYTQFFLGSFVLNIDNNKAVASGTFKTTYQLPIANNTLKGQLIEDKSIKSTNTQTTYPYTVYLPPHYATSGKQYPIIYILDGQWASDLIHVVENKNKDVIVVLLSSISEARRDIDFVAPGAEAYIKFLKEEFIPAIESSYNTNQERTLMAGSLGGSLAAILLTKEPVGIPYFKNYIVGDGTFWIYPPEYLQAEESRYKASNSMPINLLLSTCRQGQITSVLAATKRYGDRHYQGMNIMYKEYQVQHVETAPVTFNDYIDVLY